MQGYYLEFLTIAFAHLVAVASPGPDFAVVLKQAVRYGRKTALITSVGVGSAILLHVAYALAGIGIIIKTTPWLYQLLLIFAAGFLFYIGINAIQAKPQTAAGIEQGNGTMSPKRAYVIGFMTNGLNPKATLFFISLFTLIISTETPTLIKMGYGIYLAVATTLWFSLLSYLFTITKFRNKLTASGYIFDRVMGAVLIILALHIFVTEIIT